MRTLLLVIFSGLLVTGVSEALAQTPQPAIPTPGPGQIVFVGKVRAPAGTTITLEALNEQTLEVTQCDSRTVASSGADPAISRFALVASNTCVGALRICWNNDLCVYPTAGNRGQIVDLGLAVPDTFGTIGNAPSIPSTGEGADSKQRATYPWLLWAGVAALGAGLALAGGGLFARRRR